MKSNLRNLRLSIALVCTVLTNIVVSQTAYTFTSGVATGNVGPTQTQMDSEYTGTTLDGDVTVTAGIQYWIVPTTGSYSIECFGGQGYGSFGGRGAHIYSEFNLTAGQTFKILVGQRAGNYFDWPNTGYDKQFGGGGGSFVTLTDDTPLVIAGGGGGNHGTSFIPQCDGQITEAASSGLNASTTGAGGINGQGGTQAASADAGGGLLTNGDGVAGGQAFVNGGLGGIDEGTGGFGCGGGTSSWNNYRGGGGGGYSGGGGANNSGSCCPAAGGGGSYNNGTNTTSIAGVQTGDGMIIITSLCASAAGTLAADVTSLNDVTEDCVVSTLIAPTATNNCGTLNGTSNAVLPINTVGTTIVTWTYDDGQNIVTQDQNIIISGIDSTPPVANSSSLTDFTSGQCSFSPATPTATDQCMGLISGVSDVTLPIGTVGSTLITWSYDDGNGNILTQTQTITINDVTAPAADVSTLSVLEACAEATPPTPTATDPCNGSINGTPNVTFPITASGLTVVTWTYDDGNGNSSSQTQDVVVTTIDVSTTITGPTISANATGTSYQWVDCSTNQTIGGQTNQAYTTTAVGDYSVIVSDGTCTDTSACEAVNYLGDIELNYELINIFPNPTADGIFTVSIDSKIDAIAVIDASGRVIQLPTNLTTGKINGSSLAAGKYIIRVVTADTVYAKQIIILD